MTRDAPHAPRRPRVRRALSQPTTPVQARGDATLAPMLNAALRAGTGEPDRFTHGFHSYPARMHPDIARALLHSLAKPGTRVLDPFCGSGTVLVEAMVAGHLATGVDLNPLAIRIAREHCALRSPEARVRFEAALAAVTDASLVRVQERQRVRAALSPREREFYEPHVLLELAGLFEEIQRVRPDTDRRALEIVFSALLVKFSRQQADTSERLTEKRIRKGLVSEFFQRKGHELSERWAALWEASPVRARPPTLHTGDARALPKLLAREAPFDLVISSPPYGGTYDYHAHHARRYPWLGLDAQALERNEIGARRRLGYGRAARGTWEGEVAAYLRSIALVCRRDARVALLCGDAEVGGVHVDAAEQLARLASAAGFDPLATASHLRRDPRAERRDAPARREHLVLLKRR